MEGRIEVSEKKYNCFKCGVRIYFDQRRKPLSPNSKGKLTAHKCKVKPVVDTQIKAIPTFYKGIKMRSRLEANFAAFLDSLEIKWQYEPHGFLMQAMSNHPLEHYYPDFYLPEQDTYVELKNPERMDQFLSTTADHFVMYLHREGKSTNFVVATNTKMSFFGKSRWGLGAWPYFLNEMRPHTVKV